MVAAVLGVMDRFSPGPRDRHRPLTWHRFTEALKVMDRNIDGHTNSKQRFSTKFKAKMHPCLPFLLLHDRQSLGLLGGLGWATGTALMWARR